MKLLYYKKTIAAAILVITAVSMLSASVLASPVYNDVPGTHWAHPFISKVADRGLMLGDTFANFRPDEMLDKFETSKILARSAGFKYENISAQEQEYCDACYEKNKALLNQYNSKFSRWTTSADREIAFLLEKEILTPADLNQFIVIGNNNTEQIRALSRGEVAVFIAKLLGRTTEALAYTTNNLFQDDADIPAAAKPYVYYLRSINIISGDANGNFNANGAVTRAVMATLLARVLDIMESPSPVSAGSNAGASMVSTVTGTIDAYYANLNAVQILTGTGEKKIYRLSSGGSVHIDGFLRTGADLREGMVVIAVLNNDEIIDIRAQGITSPSGSPPPTTTNVQDLELDGTVSSVSQDGTTRTIRIEIKTVNPRDNTIVSDIRSYTLAQGCKITRNDAEIQFSDIVRGDIVTAKVSGDMVYALTFEERILILKDARLEEKRYNAETGQASYVVVDSKGKHYELRVASNTTISRKGVGVTTWDRLRVGDVVDLTAEYGTLKDIVAYGVLSTVDGWIHSINIGTFQSYITLRNSYGEMNRYYAIPETVDIYSLRVGNKMRLRLDSEEISTVMLIEEASSEVVTGYVDTVRSNSITILNTQPHGINGKRTIEIDSATVFTNTKTGDHVNFNAIRAGQRVYVVCYNAGSNLARTVTILSD